MPVLWMAQSMPALIRYSAHDCMLFKRSVLPNTPLLLESVQINIFHIKTIGISDFYLFCVSPGE